MGGNKPLFDILKEYEIQDLELNKKYAHPAVRWYQRKHMAQIDGMLSVFTEPMPPKTFKEKAERFGTNAE